MSKVAVVRTNPEDVLADVERAMRLGGAQTALDRSAPTILKDNISWHMPFLSANTTPWQAEGTVLALRAMGFDNLTTVHNDTVVTDPFIGERLNRLDPVWRRHDVPQLYNFREADMRWVDYHPPFELTGLAHVYGRHGLKIPEYFIGKNVVHLPTMKCHVYTTTTGAMKNAFGGLLGTKRHYNHTWIHEVLVDLLAIQQDIHPGLFAVMDGTIAGDGAGPRTMRPVQADLMLASADQVAIDAVAARLMGFDPLSIPYIRMAHERGLGCGDPRQVELVGDDVAGVDLGFRVGHNFASRVGTTLWFSPLRSVQHLFFHTPLVNAFVWASHAYHDYLWWPLIGVPRQRKVRKDTGWGRLFEEYPDA